MLILFDNQLKCLIRTNHLQTVMWMIWLTFAQKQFKTYFSIFIPHQTIVIDDKILQGLILKSNLSFKRKVKFTKLSAKIMIITYSPYENRNIYRTAWKIQLILLNTTAFLQELTNETVFKKVQKHTGLVF